MDGNLAEVGCQTALGSDPNHVTHVTPAPGPLPASPPCHHIRDREMDEWLRWLPSNHENKKLEFRYPEAHINVVWAWRPTYNPILRKRAQRSLEQAG